MKKQALTAPQAERAAMTFDSLVGLYQELCETYGPDTKIAKAVDNILSDLDNFQFNFRSV